MPHRPLLLSLALLAASLAGQRPQAYLDPISAAPGEQVTVHVSSSSSAVVAIVFHARSFAQRVEVLRLPAVVGETRTTERGSYAFAASTPALQITGAITLEAWVRPLLAGNGRFQGIVSKYDSPGDCAYNLYLMPGGEVAFYLGDAAAFSTANRLVSSRPLANRRYTHVVATWDGTTKRIYLDGQLDVSEDWAGPLYTNAQPVRVGKYGTGGELFDGQLDAPAIYDRALSESEIAQRTAERASYGATSTGVLPGTVALWYCDELEGTTLADASGNGHDLTIVNNAARGVAGPAPRTGPLQSRAVRFARDDLFNPQWPATFRFTVDASWPSGFYYVQVNDLNGRRKLPLVVRPDPARRNRIAVLAATNTWHAYNSWAGNSLYTKHANGEICYYVGMRQPNPGAEVDVHTPGVGIAHLVDAERYLYEWLDGHGYAFDLLSDLDLHRDAALLSNYDVLILNGHSEYWSHEMIDHVEAFQAAGGSVVNLSGNTMWSLVTFDSSLSVMEGRKHPHGSGTIPASERWHSQAGGVLGGTLRCIGRPEHAVIGTGYGIGGGAARGWCVVTDPAHWVFAGTGVRAGDRFGESGLNGGSMMGFEVDVVDPQWTPPNAQRIAVGAYPTPTFQLGITNCQTRTSWNVTEGGDVLYFDHPGGGAVFGIPSVTAGGSLVVDAVATRMLQNVLARFLAPRASCAFRNGSGVNPTGFDCVTMPVLGAVWRTEVATVASTVSTGVGLAAAAAQVPFAGGELLLGTDPPPVFLSGIGSHSVTIPYLGALLGAPLTSQGFRVDSGPRLVLLNAQDLVVGR